MSEIVFTVRSSSSSERYRLRARRTEAGVHFSCTCPAGEKGQHCKHRVALLVGDVSSVVDVDQDAVAALHDMARQSPILPALERVASAEDDVAQSQARLKAAKQALSRALMG